MPNFKSGNFKQKNKPFKGAKKANSTFKGLKAVQENQAAVSKSKKIQKENKKAQKSNFKANRKNAKKTQQWAKPAALCNDADRQGIVQKSAIIRLLFDRRRERVCVESRESKSFTKGHSVLPDECHRLRGRYRELGVRVLPSGESQARLRSRLDC